MSFAICTRCSRAAPCSSPLMTSAYLAATTSATRALQQRFLSLGEFAEALLPLGGLAHPGRLHGRDLVLGAIGRPVGVVGGDHIRAGFREVERGVDHARLHALGDARAQHRISGAARDAHPIALGNAALLRIVRMDLHTILVVPAVVLGAPRLRADVVLAQDAARGEDQRVLGIDLLAGRHVLGHQEFALAAHELADVHGGRALGMLRRCRATGCCPARRCAA